MQKVLNLISANLENKEIEIILDIEEVKVFNYENELIQVLLNILNNAKDALIQKKGEKYLFINCHKKKNHLIISIYDNAGGIEEDILSRIYEPYFTTKFKSQGTGIGLYMSKNITENNLEGEISTQNINFVYKDSSFFGALFELKIPLK
jgi:C4-dicarboxylate-specific signal transduction histidine kinase